MATSRNTPTQRLCPECQGAGESVHNDSNPYGYGPDPQQEVSVSCVECAGHGWVRFAPVDALDALRSQRQLTRKILGRLSASPMLQAHTRKSYALAKAAAFAPVVLP